MIFRFLGALTSIAFLFGAEAKAQSIQAPPLAGPVQQVSPRALKQILHPRYTVLPAKQYFAPRAESQAAVGATVPLWSRTLNGYHYQMVGQNPFVALTQQTTNVPVVVVPMALQFTSFGNITFDPTLNDPACLGNRNAKTVTTLSPLFHPVTLTAGGTSIGTGNYIDLFQRANYNSQTNPNGLNPNYHTNLNVTVSPIINVTVSGFDVVGGTCGNLGLIDINTWDNYLQTQILPLLAAQSPKISPPNTLTLFLLYNVVLYDTSVSNCCFLGYHSAFNDPAYGGALHTYTSLEFDSNQSFGGSVADISVMSHELGEWLDDPTGNNPTPSWGNIGQVSGCQGNLEVGDPLSGTVSQIFMPSNRFTYHVQDLAFTSWFYGQTPSIGVNGWYSFLGTLLMPAAPC